MAVPGRYFIVDAGVLPEVFKKVVEAKRLLETGEAKTVNQATLQVGISRSAFYKYKDAVRPFNDMLSGRIVTLQLALKDEPGVLSNVLNIIAGLGATSSPSTSPSPQGAWPGCRWGWRLPSSM